MRVLLITLLLAAPALADEAAVKSIELPHFQPYLPPGAAARAVRVGVSVVSFDALHHDAAARAGGEVGRKRQEDDQDLTARRWTEDQAAPLAQYLVAMQQSPPDPMPRGRRQSGAEDSARSE
jgi:hypothetical protein